MCSKSPVWERRGAAQHEFMALGFYSRVFCSLGHVGHRKVHGGLKEVHDGHKKVCDGHISPHMEDLASWAFLVLVAVWLR